MKLQLLRLVTLNLALLIVFSCSKKSSSTSAVGQRCNTDLQTEDALFNPYPNIVSPELVYKVQDEKLKKLKCDISDKTCLDDLIDKELQYEESNWKQVVAYVENARVNEHSYILKNRTFVCHHFALSTIFDARRKGFLAFYAGITPADKSQIGHAVAAFPTSDRGWVFVDFTSASNSNQCMKMIHGLEANKKIVTLLLNDGIKRDLLDFDNQYTSFKAKADPTWKAFNDSYYPSKIEISSPFREFHADEDEIVKKWVESVWSLEDALKL